MSHCAIFDIGKTNKKFVIFDADHQEVYHEYTQFEERIDEDGFPCDDIEALQQWVVGTLQQALQNPNFKIHSLNVSAHGASFVHVDKQGQLIPPLFNYLKPYPEDLLARFYQQYGDPEVFAQETASPPLGMLNSGLQLYWLKYAKPHLFQQIRWSFHLPQFVSYLLTGIPYSDYTSIGCHTGLWDFDKHAYHRWVYEEQIDRLLPPIAHTHTTNQQRINGQEISVGIGIHDSSAALVPYLQLQQDPFLVLSTGTWNIALNPFNQVGLTAEELQQDCLQFMRIDGQPVKASRLFLGHEYQVWTKRLAEYFHQSPTAHQFIKPDASILQQLSDYPARTFRWDSIPCRHELPVESRLDQFASFSIAYHKLMQELVELQTRALLLVQGDKAVQRLYVEGGFVDNQLFLHFLHQAFKDSEISATSTPFGSAIGAAIVVDSSSSGIDHLTTT
ncbi:MAG: FGGY family carbohydrate kinase [Bacteroidota bacterium]